MNLHHDREAFEELIIGAANELMIPTNIVEKDYEEITFGLLFVPETYDTVITGVKQLADSKIWN